MASFFRRIGLVLALAVAGSLSLAAAAHDYQARDMRVLHPIAAASLRGVPNGVGYASFVNGGAGADRLVRMSSPVAERVEIHTMEAAGGVMRMRAVDPLVVEAGQTVKMGAGGTHFMFVGLRAPLKPGDHFPVTLAFERNGELTIEMHVDEAKAGSAKPAAHTH